MHRSSRELFNVLEGVRACVGDRDINKISFNGVDSWVWDEADRTLFSK